MKKCISLTVIVTVLLLASCKNKNEPGTGNGKNTITVMLAPAGGLGATAGGKCTVTAGDYTGKTGTYSKDSDGNWWCDLEGGTSVECTGGRCADALVISTPVHVAIDSGNLNIMVAKANDGAGPSKGGKCKVTQGDHTGKTGTYSQDDDGNWWCNLKDGQTSVECTGGRCENVRIVSGGKGAMQIDIISGLYLIEEKGETLHCISLVDKASGEIVKNICVPLVVTPVKALASSKNGTERKIAEFATSKKNY